MDAKRQAENEHKHGAPRGVVGWQALVCFLAVLAAALGPGGPQTARAGQPAPQPVPAQVQSILDRLAKDADLGQARESLDGVFKTAAMGEISPAELSPLVVAMVVVQQLAEFDSTALAPDPKPVQVKPQAMAPSGKPQPQTAPPRRAIALLQFLRATPALWTTLPLLVREDRESSAAVWQVLDELRLARGAMLGRFAELTAAICVVHDDRPRRVDPDLPPLPGAVEIFDYFTTHANEMIFRPDVLPAELLIYLVDAEAAESELLWALGVYRRNPYVGLRFFEVPFDFEHYLLGQPKRGSTVDRTLPNLLRLGGSCEDQAYFAAQVGKAIGVPAAVTTGATGRSSHAWVGYLEARDRLVRWNFDSGRYPEFQGTRGIVLDPQIRKPVPDGQVALLAALLPTRPADRHLAAVWTEGARLLLDRYPPARPSSAGVARGPSGSAPATQPAPGQPAGRGAKAAVQPDPRVRALQWLESALLRSPGHLPAWLTVSSMAHQLTREEKEYWIRLLDRFCGSEFPDFTWTFLGPLIQSEPDLGRQAWIWERCAVIFEDRPDLAAEARLEQGRMWQGAGEVARAWACYEDVVRRFADAGPVVITALERLEQLLPGEEPGRVLALYDSAWSLLKAPAVPARREQSNWFQVGRMFADRLEKAGYPDRAWAIRTRIGQKPGPEKERPD